MEKDFFKDNLKNNVEITYHLVKGDAITISASIDDDISEENFKEKAAIEILKSMKSQGIINLACVIICDENRNINII